MFEENAPRARAGQLAVRVALVLLALTVVAALGAASWNALMKPPRSEHADAMDPRPAYVNRVREKIQKTTEMAWSRLPRQGKPGLLRLRIEVGPEGQLLSTSIVESSGIPSLDELALRIVRESAPFEPFPDAVRKNTKTMEITSGFDFQ